MRIWRLLLILVVVSRGMLGVVERMLFTGSVISVMSMLPLMVITGLERRVCIGIVKIIYIEELISG
jgi:hypothetical protein